MAIAPLKRGPDDSLPRHEGKKGRNDHLDLRGYFTSSIAHQIFTNIAGHMGYGNFDKDYREGICTGISTMANICYLSKNHKFYDSILEKIQIVYQKHHGRLQNVTEELIAEYGNDLRVFFDGAIYAQRALNGDLSLLIATDQEFFENDIYALLNPSTFDGSIQQKGVITGVFFPLDIITMLRLMIEYVEHNKSPIALSFANHDHLISLFMDPSDRTFTLIDANYLPPKKTDNLDEISDVIYRVMTEAVMDRSGTFPPLDKKGALIGIKIIGIDGKLDIERMPRMKQLFSKQDVAERSQLTIHGRKWEYEAGLHGDRESLEALIEEKGGRGSDLLEALALRGRSDLFKMVFEHRLKTMEKPLFGTTKALCIAAQYGHFHLVKTLCESGASIKGQYKEKTPIHFASRNGQMQIVEYFLSKRALKKGSPELTECFLNAAKGGHLDLFIMLAQKYPSLLTKESLENAFMSAVVGEHYGVCRHMISHGVHVDFRSEIDGLTPLIKSAVNGSVAHVEFLINLGASPFASCAEGFLPIEYAVKRGDASIVAYLAQFHRPFNLLYNFKGDTLIACAIRHGYLDVLKVLQENAISLHELDSSSKSSLMYALEFNQKEIFRYLLRQNVSPYIKNREGVSVLSKCISEANLEFLSLILRSL